MNNYVNAAREVKEGTGIDTEIVAFRHGNFPFAMEEVSKFYVCCLLSPKDTKITIQESEIRLACWMPLQEFKAVAKGIFADFLETYQKSSGTYIKGIINYKKGTTLYSPLTG